MHHAYRRKRGIEHFIVNRNYNAENEAGKVHLLLGVVRAQ
jgi:hypothetical protein